MTLIAPHYKKANKKAFFSFLKKDRYLIKTPWWLKKLYPDCLWDITSKEKILYLSFDDGPHLTITPFILDLLKKYNAKATFFCIGDNVTRYPEIYQRLLSEGHAVGNHTHHHINGWKSGDEKYIADVEKAAIYIKSHLFRPPYGRVSRSQIKRLRSGERPYKIVMWNILAGDWDPDLQPLKCYSRIKNRISTGDIIVFHDSEKAWDRMSYAVPLLLKDFSERGYKFEVIG
jgi:peptidoglycan-N-acetylglucosamine deacetylase